MLIGLVGRSGAGKDAVAQFIAPKHLVDFEGTVLDVRPHTRVGAPEPQHQAIRAHGAQIANADPMKVFMRKVYDFTFPQLWGPSELRNAPDKRYCRESKEHGAVRDGACVRCGSTEANAACISYLSPREALQQLGTEWGRTRWEGTWVRMSLAWAYRLTSGVRVQKAGAEAHTFAPNWVLDRVDCVAISDVRFVNEARMIRDAGGEVWRITRPEADEKPATHASERELQSPEMGHLVSLTLDNRGSLDDLYAEVVGALG